MGDGKETEKKDKEAGSKQGIYDVWGHFLFTVLWVTMHGVFTLRKHSQRKSVRSIQYEQSVIN